MSDPNVPQGQPDEAATVDDVVGSANEGLRDAEAAGRGAAPDPAAGASADAVTDAPAETPADAAASDSVPWYERDDVPLDDDAPPPLAEPATATAAEPTSAVAAPAAADEEPTVVITPSEPVEERSYVAPAAVATAAAQPIFVQAPEPPRPRGNRAAAGAIGLLATILFAVLFLGVALVVWLIGGDITPDEVGTALTTAVGSWSFWTPVVVFFLAFWLLGAIINRGRWAHWVIFGLFVGVASYGGYLLGQLLQAPFWRLTVSEGTDLVEANLLVPLAIAGFVIGRELTIWFGAWVATRGKRITELNYEAQREYERTLEAGPTIVPSAQG